MNFLKSEDYDYKQSEKEKKSSYILGDQDGSLLEFSQYKVLIELEQSLLQAIEYYGLGSEKTLQTLILIIRFLIKNGMNFMQKNSAEIALSYLSQAKYLLQPIQVIEDWKLNYYDWHKQRVFLGCNISLIYRKLGRSNQGLAYLSIIEKELSEITDFFSAAFQDHQFNLEVLFFQIGELKYQSHSKIKDKDKEVKQYMNLVLQVLGKILPQKLNLSNLSGSEQKRILMQASCLYYLGKYDKNEEKESDAIVKYKEAHYIAEQVLGADDPLTIRYSKKLQQLQQKLVFHKYMNENDDDDLLDFLEKKTFNKQPGLQVLRSSLHKNENDLDGDFSDSQNGSAIGLSPGEQLKADRKVAFNNQIAEDDNQGNMTNFSFEIEKKMKEYDANQGNRENIQMNIDLVNKNFNDERDQRLNTQRSQPIVDQIEDKSSNRPQTAAFQNISGTIDSDSKGNMKNYLENAQVKDDDDQRNKMGLINRKGRVQIKKQNENLMLKESALLGSVSASSTKLKGSPRNFPSKQSEYFTSPEYLEQLRGQFIKSAQTTPTHSRPQSTTGLLSIGGIKSGLQSTSHSALLQSYQMSRNDAKSRIKSGMGSALLSEKVSIDFSNNTYSNIGVIDFDATKINQDQSGKSQDLQQFHQNQTNHRSNSASRPYDLFGRGEEVIKMPSNMYTLLDVQKADDNIPKTQKQNEDLQTFFPGLENVQSILANNNDQSSNNNVNQTSKDTIDNQIKKLDTSEEDFSFPKYQDLIREQLDQNQYSVFPNEQIKMKLTDQGGEQDSSGYQSKVAASFLQKSTLSSIQIDEKELEKLEQKYDFQSQASSTQVSQLKSPKNAAIEIYQNTVQSVSNGATGARKLSRPQTSQGHAYTEKPFFSSVGDKQQNNQNQFEKQEDSLLKSVFGDYDQNIQLIPRPAPSGVNGGAGGTGNVIVNATEQQQAIPNPGTVATIPFEVPETKNYKPLPQEENDKRLSIDSHLISGFHRRLPNEDEFNPGLSGGPYDISLYESKKNHSPTESVTTKHVLKRSMTQQIDGAQQFIGSSTIRTQLTIGAVGRSRNEEGGHELLGDDLVNENQSSKNSQLHFGQKKFSDIGQTVNSLHNKLNESKNTGKRLSRHSGGSQIFENSNQTSQDQDSNGMKSSNGSQSIASNNLNNTKQGVPNVNKSPNQQQGSVLVFATSVHQNAKRSTYRKKTANIVSADGKVQSSGEIYEKQGPEPEIINFSNNLNELPENVSNNNSHNFGNNSIHNTSNIFKGDDFPTTPMSPIIKAQIPPQVKKSQFNNERQQNEQNNSGEYSHVMNSNSNNIASANSAGQQINNVFSTSNNNNNNNKIWEDSEQEEKNGGDTSQHQKSFEQIVLNSFRIFSPQADYNNQASPSKEELSAIKIQRMWRIINFRKKMKAKKNQESIFQNMPSAQSFNFDNYDVTPVSQQSINQQQLQQQLYDEEQKVGSSPLNSPFNPLFQVEKPNSRSRLTESDINKEASSSRDSQSSRIEINTAMNSRINTAQSRFVPVSFFLSCFNFQTKLVHIEDIIFQLIPIENKSALPTPLLTNMYQVKSQVNKTGYSNQSQPPLSDVHQESYKCQIKLNLNIEDTRFALDFKLNKVLTYNDLKEINSSKYTLFNVLLDEWCKKGNLNGLMGIFLQEAKYQGNYPQAMIPVKQEQEKVSEQEALQITQVIGKISFLIRNMCTIRRIVTGKKVFFDFNPRKLNLISQNSRMIIEWQQYLKQRSALIHGLACTVLESPIFSYLENDNMRFGGNSALNTSRTINMDYSVSINNELRRIKRSNTNSMIVREQIKKQINGQYFKMGTQQIDGEPRGNARRNSRQNSINENNNNFNNIVSNQNFSYLDSFLTLTEIQASQTDVLEQLMRKVHAEKKNQSNVKQMGSFTKFKSTRDIQVKNPFQKQAQEPQRKFDDPIDNINEQTQKQETVLSIREEEKQHNILHQLENNTYFESPDMKAKIRILKDDLIIQQDRVIFPILNRRRSLDNIENPINDDNRANENENQNAGIRKSNSINMKLSASSSPRQYLYSAEESMVPFQQNTPTTAKSIFYRMMIQEKEKKRLREERGESSDSNIRQGRTDGEEKEQESQSLKQDDSQDGSQTSEIQYKNPRSNVEIPKLNLDADSMKRNSQNSYNNNQSILQNSSARIKKEDGSVTPSPIPVGLLNVPDIKSKYAGRNSLEIKSDRAIQFRKKSIKFPAKGENELERLPSRSSIQEDKEFGTISVTNEEMKTSNNNEKFEDKLESAKSIFLDLPQPGDASPYYKQFGQNLALNSFPYPRNSQDQSLFQDIGTPISMNLDEEKYFISPKNSNNYRPDFILNDQDDISYNYDAFINLLVNAMTHYNRQRSKEDYFGHYYQLLKNNPNSLRLRYLKPQTNANPFLPENFLFNSIVKRSKQFFRVVIFMSYPEELNEHIDFKIAKRVVVFQVRVIQLQQQNPWVCEIDLQFKDFIRWLVDRQDVLQNPFLALRKNKNEDGSVLINRDQKCSNQHPMLKVPNFQFEQFIINIGFVPRERINIQNNLDQYLHIVNCTAQFQFIENQNHTLALKQSKQNKTLQIQELAILIGDQDYERFSNNSLQKNQLHFSKATMTLDYYSQLKKKFVKHEGQSERFYRREYMHLLQMKDITHVTHSKRNEQDENSEFQGNFLTKNPKILQINTNNYFNQFSAATLSTYRLENLHSKGGQSKMNPYLEQPSPIQQRIHMTRVNENLIDQNYLAECGLQTLTQYNTIKYDTESIHRLEISNQQTEQLYMIIRQIETDVAIRERHYAISKFSSNKQQNDEGNSNNKPNGGTGNNQQSDIQYYKKIDYHISILKPVLRKELAKTIIEDSATKQQIENLLLMQPTDLHLEDSSVTLMRKNLITRCLQSSRSRIGKVVSVLPFFKQNGESDSTSSLMKSLRVELHQKQFQQIFMNNKLSSQNNSVPGGKNLAGENNFIVEASQFGEQVTLAENFYSQRNLRRILQTNERLYYYLMSNQPSLQDTFSFVHQMKLFILEENTDEYNFSAFLKNKHETAHVGVKNQILRLYFDITEINFPISFQSHENHSETNSNSYFIRIIGFRAKRFLVTQSTIAFFRIEITPREFERTKMFQLILSLQDLRKIYDSDINIDNCFEPLRLNKFGIKLCQSLVFHYNGIRQNFSIKVSRVIPLEHNSNLDLGNSMCTKPSRNLWNHFLDNTTALTPIIRAKRTIFQQTIVSGGQFCILSVCHVKYLNYYCLTVYFPKTTRQFISYMYLSDLTNLDEEFVSETYTDKFNLFFIDAGIQFMMKKYKKYKDFVKKIDGVLFGESGNYVMKLPEAQGLVPYYWFKQRNQQNSSSENHKSASSLDLKFSQQKDIQVPIQNLVGKQEDSGDKSQSSADHGGDLEFQSGEDLLDAAQRRKISQSGSNYQSFARGFRRQSIDNQQKKLVTISEQASPPNVPSKSQDPGNQSILKSRENSVMMSLIEQRRDQKSFSLSHIQDLNLMGDSTPGLKENLSQYFQFIGENQPFEKSMVLFEMHIWEQLLKTVTLEINKHHQLILKLDTYKGIMRETLVDTVINLYQTQNILFEVFLDPLKDIRFIHQKFDSIRINQADQCNFYIRINFFQKFSCTSEKLPLNRLLYLYFEANKFNLLNIDPRTQTSDALFYDFNHADLIKMSKELINSIKEIYSKQLRLPSAIQSFFRSTSKIGDILYNNKQQRLKQKGNAVHQKSTFKFSDLQVNNILNIGTVFNINQNKSFVLIYRTVFTLKPMQMIAIFYRAEKKAFYSYIYNIQNSKNWVMKLNQERLLNSIPHIDFMLEGRLFKELGFRIFQAFQNLIIIKSYYKVNEE